MILSALECGGQGRNRTADASLFRAAIFQSYLIESIEHDAVFHLEKLRLSATKCNQPARSDLLKCLLVDARHIFSIGSLAVARGQRVNLIGAVARQGDSGGR